MPKVRLVCAGKVQREAAEDLQLATLSAYFADICQSTLSLALHGGEIGLASSPAPGRAHRSSLLKHWAPSCSRSRRSSPRLPPSLSARSPSMLVPHFCRFQGTFEWMHGLYGIFCCASFLILWGLQSFKASTVMGRSRNPCKSVFLGPSYLCRASTRPQKTKLTSGCEIASRGRPKQPLETLNKVNKSKSNLSLFDFQDLSFSLARFDFRSGLLIFRFLVRLLPLSDFSLFGIFRRLACYR